MKVMLVCAAFAVAALGPFVQDGNPPMDCLCAFTATSVSTVPHAQQPNSDPSVAVEFSETSHSGSCSGELVCPEVEDCSGSASILVIAKPFTQMGVGQGSTFGVGNVGIYPMEDAVTGCGFFHRVWLEVFASTTGKNLGELELTIACSRCSDS